MDLPNPLAPPIRPWESASLKFDSLYRLLSASPSLLLREHVSPFGIPCSFPHNPLLPSSSNIPPPPFDPSSWFSDLLSLGNLKTSPSIALAILTTPTANFSVLSPKEALNLFA